MHLLEKMEICCVTGLRTDKEVGISGHGFGL